MRLHVRYRFKYSVATSLALILSISATNAYAADKAADDAAAANYDVVYEAMDEIIVKGRYLANEKFSGTKTPTLIVNVPQSLSVITAAQIQEQGFNSLGDVIDYTPGVANEQGEGHRDQTIIRGQNSTADFFLDGLRDDIQYYRPLYNLQQVEILRGSNAMIFGRGGGGGVINRVTKKPIQGETFNRLAGWVDTFGAYAATTDNNFTVNDKASIRLNGLYEEFNNHRDEYDGERYAINPTARLTLQPDTQLLLSYEYVNDDRLVDRGVPADGGKPLDGYHDMFFGDPDANKTDLEAHIARARLDHHFSDDLNFNATVQYADYDKFYQNIYPVGYDRTAQTVRLDGYGNLTKRQNLIGQANLVADLDFGGLHHTFLIGGEYTHQDTDNSRRDVFFADSQDDQITIDFTNPLNIPAFSFPKLTRNADTDVDVYSIYLQDQIDIGRYVKIVGGIRYDNFEIDVTDHIEIDDGIADGNDGEHKRKDDEISPRLGLIIKPQDNISLYGSYSQSFLPRSGDQFVSLSPSSETLKPEEFRNYEIGAKWDIHPGLAVSAAIFRLDRDQGSTTDPSDPGNSILVGSRTEGLELQLIGQITEAWHLNVGYSYLEAKERGRVVGNELANREMPHVPEDMFSIWSRYDLTPRFGVGMGVSYQSEKFTSIGNKVKLPDATRVDAAIYYDIRDDLALQLNVENLLDSHFYPSAHNDNNIATSRPLNARLTIRGEF